MECFGDSRLSALRTSEGRLIDAVPLLGHAIGTDWLVRIAADLTLPACKTSMFARIAVCLFSIFPCSLSITYRLGFHGLLLGGVAITSEVVDMT